MRISAGGRAGVAKAEAAGNGELYRGLSVAVRIAELHGTAGGAGRGYGEGIGGARSGEAKLAHEAVVVAWGCFGVAQVLF